MPATIAILILLFAAAAVRAQSKQDFDRALADRKHFPAADYPCLYYVSTFPHVGEEATALERAIKLAMASDSTQQILDRCVPVHLGDGLFRIDLRDQHWRVEDWDTVAYHRNPYALPHESPLVVRADWLLEQISDQHESDSYLRLLFGGNNIPKTIDDVRKFFHVDNDPDLRFGMIVGQSGVNKQGTRWMESRPVSRGYYWQTFDALELDENRDPIEHPDGTFAFNGSEIIVGLPKLWLGDKTNAGKWGTLQVYFLTNGQNVIVDRAPVDLVSDATKFRGYDEIRNPGSCIQCHKPGLNLPTKNEFRDLLRSGVDVFAGHQKKEQLESFHLSDLKDQFDRANEDFQTAVTFACADDKSAKLDPAKFSAQVCADFKSSILAYDAPLNLEQTATELDVTVPEWTTALATNGTLPARLASLAHGGTVPRIAWEEQFVEAYYATHGGRPIKDVPPVEKPKSAPSAPKQQQPKQQQNNRRRAA